MCTLMYISLGVFFKKVCKVSLFQGEKRQHVVLLLAKFFVHSELPTACREEARFTYKHQQDALRFVRLILFNEE
jgi:hypothetical protein